MSFFLGMDGVEGGPGVAIGRERGGADEGSRAAGREGGERGVGGDEWWFGG